MKLVAACKFTATFETSLSIAFNLNDLDKMHSCVRAYHKWSSVRSQLTKKFGDKDTIVHGNNNANTQESKDFLAKHDPGIHFYCDSFVNKYDIASL